MAVLGTIASIAGTIVSAAGTMAAGKAAKQAANFEAQQLEIKAKEEQAAAQLEAGEHRKQKNLALSKLQANAAASGFTATDPTSLAIADEISRYGTMQEQIAQYGGKSRRAGLESQAVARRMEGKAAASAARTSAFGTIIGGVSSFAKKFDVGSSSGQSSYMYG